MIASVMPISKNDLWKIVSGYLREVEQTDPQSVEVQEKRDRLIKIRDELWDKEEEERSILEEMEKEMLEQGSDFDYDRFCMGF